MKKANLLITLLICVTASAQFDNSFGIKAGTNYSQFRADRDIPKGKISYYAGGYFNFSLTDKISLQPELLLANQGTKYSREISDHDGFDFNIENIESNFNDLSILVPFIFRYKLAEDLFLELGPQLGYLIKRTEVVKKASFDPSLEGEKTKYPLSEFDRFDLGLNGGLGFDLTDRLELNARYSWGLIELDDYYKTSVISLGLGYNL